MKKSNILLILLTSCLLNSCYVFSLFPIFTEDTLIYDPTLVGHWQQSNDILIIEGSKESQKENMAKNGYTMRSLSGEDTLDYRVHLVKIGEDTYLNVFPLSFDLEDLRRNFFPMHTFLKIEIEKNNIELVNFDLEKLTGLFQKNLIRLRHEIMDERDTNPTVVITAQPKEIQKFIQTYAKDPTVFEEGEVFTRI